YVAFKIKTKPTLVVGDTFSNSASIYFDYNFPIVTNTATTTIQQLGTNDFEFSDHFTLYPNPAQNVLHIKSTQNTIESVGIYNPLGQMILISTGSSEDIDISNLVSGTYFIRIHSAYGISTAKFIKQ
ncbi:MAG: T9SS type A sorting domain-containing protein, partial [Flavisolibacter sp.]|nr:T9SS type A sorting domain-containing protein [Flavisolibacter sp.]